MANGRNPKRRGHDTSRDQGGFVALPWTVLDCPAYARLSHPARSLLMELARQYVRDNNGKLLASSAYLAKRGWKSSDVITRAKRELIASGFIHETVMGHRPNKASWYAVTWRLLDKIPGYDFGAAETFVRGAYRDAMPAKLNKSPARSGSAGNRTSKNASPTPSHGLEDTPIGPPYGLEDVPPTPPHGPMEDTLAPTPTPSHGHHLEKPSIVVGPAATSPTVPATIQPAIMAERPRINGRLTAEKFRTAQRAQDAAIDRTAPKASTDITKRPVGPSMAIVVVVDDDGTTRERDCMPDFQESYDQGGASW